MSWHQTGTTQYHAQLGLLDKGRAIKGFVVCNNWELKPAKRSGCCYQPSPEVLIVCITSLIIRLYLIILVIYTPIINV